MVEKIVTFRTEDGKEFDSEEAATDHEKSLEESGALAFERYLNSWEGRSENAAARLEEEGLWEVRGEDPNCDLGGHHHQPFLGLFEGKLKDVIARAVLIPGWYTWGGGGSIKKKKLERITKV